MATRSTIALEFADGSVQQIYCHWDGYLENNGQILYKNYTDPFKVRDLIDLGDVSSLGKDIGVKHPFDTYHLPDDERAKYEDMTTFYMRDRGETGCDARKFADYAEFEREGQREEYNYILRRDGNWYVECGRTNDKFVLLADAIAEELRERAMEEEAPF